MKAQIPGVGVLNIYTAPDIFYKLVFGNLEKLFRVLEFPHFDETINKGVKKAFFLAYKKLGNCRRINNCEFTYPAGHKSNSSIVLLSKKTSSAVKTGRMEPKIYIKDLTFIRK